MIQVNNWWVPVFEPKCTSINRRSEHILKAIEFCELIDKLQYSEEKNNNKIQRLVNLLIELVKANKIISKEEQIKIEKNKSRYSLRKMIISCISKKKLENKKNNRKND